MVDIEYLTWLVRLSLVGMYLDITECEHAAQEAKADAKAHALNILKASGPAPEPKYRNAFSAWKRLEVLGWV